MAPSHKHPACTLSLVGINTSFLVPDNMRKKFIDGWNVHIPLTYLTNKGCSWKDKSSTSQDLFTIDSLSHHISTSSKPLSDKGELDLSFDKWHQAWQLLLELIREFISKEFLLWEIHYNHILNSENHAELWPLYLAYNNEVRRRTTQFPINPLQFSIGIWNDLEARYTAKKVLVIIQSDMKTSTNHSSSFQPNTPYTPTPYHQSNFHSQDPPSYS